MNFEEVMKFTRTVSSHTAFEDEECEAYFNILNSLPHGALIVEVGLEYGRSSSIALQVARERRLRYVGIDPFINHEDIHKKWLWMAGGINSVDCRLIVGKSCDTEIKEPIHAILIDGDHEYEAVRNDCEHFLPQIIEGGYAIFHDFARGSLPEVYRAVQEYMDSSVNWEHTGTYGTLGVWRRRG